MSALSGTSLRAMRKEIEGLKKPPGRPRGVPVMELFKVATEGHGQPSHQYEEMNKAKWKQTLKDLPIAVLGTAAGYGLGRTTSEYLLPHIFKTPGSHEVLKKALPAATAVAGGLGSYMLAVQRRMLQERREEAARNAAREQGGTSYAETEQIPSTPVNSPPPKVAGAPAPAIARAKKTDPWREDTRNPPFLL